LDDLVAAISGPEISIVTYDRRHAFGSCVRSRSVRCPGIANTPEQGQARKFYGDIAGLARLSRSDFPLPIWKRK